MGGVAGHAGLFTTASDLAKFAEMMLGMGERDGVRIFSPLTVRKFTSPNTPPDQPILRGLGWDIDSPYSSNRGELYPIGSYGHTGFTGTSIWIDPSTEVLRDSVDQRGASQAGQESQRRCGAGWRRSSAASMGVDAPGVSVTGYNETLEGAGVRRMIAPNHQVLTGLDVLEQEKFARAARASAIGLITNQTGLDRQGRRNIDAMIAAGVQVTALFSPEHGLTGKGRPPRRRRFEGCGDGAAGLEPALSTGAIA